MNYTEKLETDTLFLFDPLSVADAADILPECSKSVVLDAYRTWLTDFQINLSNYDEWLWRNSDDGNRNIIRKHLDDMLFRHVRSNEGNPTCAGFDDLFWQSDPLPSNALERLNAFWFNRYCCREEQTRQILRALPYRDYLQTTHWGQVRSALLLLNGAKCQSIICQRVEGEGYWWDSQRIHVHHKTYRNRGNERYADLCLLCDVCHEAFHKYHIDPVSGLILGVYDRSVQNRIGEHGNGNGSSH